MRGAPAGSITVSCAPRARPGAIADLTAPAAAPAAGAAAPPTRANRRRRPAGTPATCCPSSMSFVTADLAPTITPRPSCTWPVTPDCPAMTTSSSSTELPAMPLCAASSAFRPIFTPCATCTRLSIFVPAAMRVSPTAGRSIVVLRADLDVVADDDARPPAGSSGACRRGGARSRTRRRRPPRRPESRPDRRSTTPSRTDTCAWSAQSAPIARAGGDRRRAGRSPCARRSATSRADRRRRDRSTRRRPVRPSDRSRRAG